MNLRKHLKFIILIFFSAFIVIAQHDSQISIITTENANQLESVASFNPTLGTDAFYSLTNIEVSKNSKYLVAILSDRRTLESKIVQIWDIETSELLTSQTYEDDIEHFSISESGELLALLLREEKLIEDAEGTIIILDIASGDKVFEQEMMNIYGLWGISPDNSRLFYTKHISGQGWESHNIVLDIATGEETILFQSTGFFEFSSLQNTFATTTNTMEVILWNIDDDNNVTPIQTYEIPSLLAHLAFTPDGQYLLFKTIMFDIYIASIDSSTYDVYPMGNSVFNYITGYIFPYETEQSETVLFDIRTKSEIGIVADYILSIHPTNPLVITIHRNESDGTCEYNLSDVTSDTVLFSWVCEDISSFTPHIMFTADGRYVVTTNNDGLVEFWGTE